MSAPPYCLCLSLDNVPCLVVGGGEVAARKSAELLRCGAKLTVVSPDLSPRLKEQLGQRRLSWLSRRVKRQDLKGVRLAVAATDDRATNQAVAGWAKIEGALINVADRPDDGDVILPSVVRRGKLSVALSTGGASPALTARLRREAEAHFGPEWEGIVDLLGRLRADLRRRGVPPTERRELMVEVSQLDLSGLAQERGPAGLRSFLEKLVEERLNLLESP